DASNLRAGGEGMSGDGAPHEGAPGPEAEAAAGERSEEELRAAYEEELSRITSSEVMLQAAVSLLNLGGWRLGPPAGAVGGEHGEPAAGQRDLEQVRDAIDGVRVLLGVLERRLSKELGPLRDALSQLQLAYAREAQAAAEQDAGAGASAGGQGRSGEQEDASAAQGTKPGRGPAEPKGRAG